MTNYLESDYQPVHRANVATRFLADTRIEVVGDFAPKAPPRHVLFDFDGTLSLIREGWPQIMVPMLVEHLSRTQTDETEDELREACRTFVMELTGKQTIYQMIRLAEEIRRRGGAPSDPLEYKHQYHQQLMRHIETRREGLRSGALQPRQMLVPGSLELLDQLRQRQVGLYLASGTDEKYVREEAELLGLNRYFGQRVFGAVDDYQSFSKAQVIRRILVEQGIDGSALLGLGDGFVEIQNVRQAGGTAVAVASDESDRSGRPDPWKRRRLIGAGAHIVVPDFADSTPLLDWLWGEG